MAAVADLIQRTENQANKRVSSEWKDEADDDTQLYSTDLRKDDIKNHKQTPRKQ